MSQSQHLVAKLKSLPLVAIPTGVREAAKLHLLDAIGVGFAAAATVAGQPYLQAGPVLNGDGGPATVIGTDRGFTAATAALANGGMFHALEYDDTHTGSIVHGSSVLAASALAAGEACAASGSDILAAYVKGWEVLIRIGLAAPGKFQAQGFQITSVAGALAAALIGAELFKLDDTRSVHAAGIALSQASGVFEFLTNGSTVKSLHAGWAAHGGIVAATLAAADLTGPETTFEGQFGLFRQFASDAAAIEFFGASLETLGETWYLPEAAFKFYPCCHYIHPFIEALENALQKMPGVAVESILCEVPLGAAPLISDPWDRKLKPQTGHEARYSLPIALAARLIEGAVTPATFANAPSAEIMAKAESISARPMEGADFPRRFEARMHVHFINGAKVESYVDDVFGGARRPPTQEAIIAKFHGNANLVGKMDDVRMLEGAILSIEDRPIADVTQLLRKFRSVNAARSRAA